MPPPPPPVFGVFPPFPDAVGAVPGRVQATKKILPIAKTTSASVKNPSRLELITLLPLILFLRYSSPLRLFLSKEDSV